MRFVEARQGTPEWFQARVGKITASCFADAISRVGALDEKQELYVDCIRIDGMSQKDAMAKAGYKAAPTAANVAKALRGEDPSDHSDTAKRYAADLAIERISNQPHGEPPKAWVLERGHEMEARARMLYEARTGAFITESGICISDDGLFGYSSDGLADDDGLIEIKAPIDSIKIMDMWRTGDTSEYDHQIQGGLWLTGRKWLDFIMFVPDLASCGKDLYVKRIYRDEAFIDKMVAQLADFDRLVGTYTTVLRADAQPHNTIEEYMEYENPTPGKSEMLASVPVEPASTPAYVDPRTTEPSYANAYKAMREIDNPPPPKAGPPSLRLGQITERLGFTVTADFMLTLGFAPAATDKASKLFHESDFKAICAAILRHVSAVQAKF